MGKDLGDGKCEASWSPPRQTDVYHQPGTLTQLSVSRVLTVDVFPRFAATSTRVNELS